ncbi:TetR/AcrR family transcriptional regulator [Aeromicrobium sp. CFBP 8757]|uniref:TetR/AcrR family transcriptional regulator n=1 Tax=Aeromicrobium sp. CFBP 8757 TaxID=2775288 RepID=UPI001A7E2D34|nr:TetR/AcrR family transcriptional regulator [Aeromicrobium sp. CFBP 8757]
MTVPTVNPPVARQARSRKTHGRIFEAGTELLLEGGIESLTVADVAKRAGVSIGSVYRRFGNKDLLLVAIQREHVSGYATSYDARVAAADLATCTDPALVVRTALTCLVNGPRNDRRLLRVFILLGTQNEAVREIGEESTRACGDVFHRALQPIRHRIRHHDVDAAIEFAYRLINATWSHRVVHGDMQSHGPLPWRDMIDELSRAVTMYLLGELPDDSPTH